MDRNGIRLGRLPVPQHGLVCNIRRSTYPSCGLESPRFLPRTRFIGNNTFLAFASRIVLTTSGVTSLSMEAGNTRFNEATMTSTVGTILKIASTPDPTCSAPAFLIASAAARFVPTAKIWQSTSTVSRNLATNCAPNPPPRPSITQTRMV